mmetsp:Transcript_46246/g.148012  ORF Transcript_46246/g.148012 Transcript_46246/m.148012 type:complete len:355 (+) Transcript_46246:185-1249(+)
MLSWPRWPSFAVVAIFVTVGAVTGNPVHPQHRPILSLQGLKKPSALGKHGIAHNSPHNIARHVVRPGQQHPAPWASRGVWRGVWPGQHQKTLLKPKELHKPKEPLRVNGLDGDAVTRGECVSTVTSCTHGAGVASDVMFPEAERVLIWTKEGMEGVSVANETGRTVMHAGYGCNAAGWPDEPKTIVYNDGERGFLWIKPAEHHKNLVFMGPGKLNEEKASGVLKGTADKLMKTIPMFPWSIMASMAAGSASRLVLQDLGTLPQDGAKPSDVLFYPAFLGRTVDRSGLAEEIAGPEARTISIASAWRGCGAISGRAAMWDVLADLAKKRKWPTPQAGGLCTGHRSPHTKYHEYLG